MYVVDRKDLDRQTRDEFNRFQENCVEENTNTAALVPAPIMSEDDADKVIVTTSQKLGLALDDISKYNGDNTAQRCVGVQAAARARSATSEWSSSSMNAIGRSSSRR